MIWHTSVAFLLYSLFLKADGSAIPPLPTVVNNADWSNIKRSADAANYNNPSTSAHDVILQANAAGAIAAARTGTTFPTLFEGDIVMTQEEIDEIVVHGNYSFRGNTHNCRSKRAVMKRGRNLWQKNKIHYTIAPHLGNKVRSLILAGIKEWYETIPCMGQWRESATQDYMSFYRGTGCFSMIGRVGGMQKISIGNGCAFHGTIVHEIGHAMGFWHEQSRPDRDNYVTIQWSNILPALRYNFKKQTTSTIDSLGEGYDYDSVMHYGSRAFSSNGRETIVAKDGRKQLGQRNGLSTSDKTQAKRLYGCDTTGPGPVVDCSDSKEFAAFCKATKDVGFCQYKCLKEIVKEHCCATCAGCKADNNEHCDYWAKQGYCTATYVNFMADNCKLACEKQKPYYNDCINKKNKNYCESRPNDMRVNCSFVCKCNLLK